MADFPGFLTDEELYGPPLPGADPGGDFLAMLRQRGMDRRNIDPTTEVKSLFANAADLGGITSALAPSFIGDPLREAAASGSGETQATGAFLAPFGVLSKIGPKAAGLGAFLWGATAGSEAGEAAKKRGSGKTQPTPATQDALSDPLYDIVAKTQDPALMAKFEMMKQKEAEARASVQGVNKESADAVRQRASDDANALRGEIASTLERMNPQPSTFRQFAGGMADAWPLMQGAAAVGAGALLGNLGRAKGRMMTGPWEKAIGDFDKAMYGGKGLFGRAPNPERAYSAAKTVKGFSDAASAKGRVEKGFEMAGKAASSSVPALGGAFVGAEVGAIPHLYNRQNAPRDSEDYKRAQDFFDDPIKGSAMNALIGAAGGFTGGKAFPFMRGATPESVLQSKSGDALARLEGKVPNLDAFTMRGPTVPQGPTGPVKPPQPPKPRVPKTARERYVNQLLDQMEGGANRTPRKPAEMSAEAAQKLRDKVGQAWGSVASSNPGMKPSEVRSTIGALRSSGALKFGAAGVPASAVLADMLSRMEDEAGEQ